MDKKITKLLVLIVITDNSRIMFVCLFTIPKPSELKSSVVLCSPLSSHFIPSLMNKIPGILNLLHLGWHLLPNPEWLQHFLPADGCKPSQCKAEAEPQESSAKTAAKLKNQLLSCQNLNFHPSANLKSCSTP